MKSLVLAVEDALSEHVGRKIAYTTGLSVTEQPHINNGKSNLQKNFPKYCQLAQREAVLLIVDMDRSSNKRPCPSALINEWVRGRTIPPKMFFRVAVHEVEAWLMADHEAMRALLGGQPKLPTNPDSLEDPKMELLNLLKRTRKYVRDNVVRVSGSELSQGLEYNAVLGKWVDETWSPERAAQKSDSLGRALRRLQAYNNNC
ncbi:hypothetical protein FACS1894187_07550 [Synergistales bacterium]|nr:hypothetical protein FACS1894187_07550 [Synergistales bacterium]